MSKTEIIILLIVALIILVSCSIIKIEIENYQGCVKDDTIIGKQKNSINAACEDELDLFILPGDL